MPALATGSDLTGCEKRLGIRHCAIDGECGLRHRAISTKLLYEWTLFQCDQLLQPRSRCNGSEENGYSEAISRRADRRSVGQVSATAADAGPAPFVAIGSKHLAPRREDRMGLEPAL